MSKATSTNLTRSLLDLLMSGQDENLLLSRDEVAALLGVTAHSVKDWADEGLLPDALHTEARKKCLYSWKDLRDTLRTAIRTGLYVGTMARARELAKLQAKKATKVGPQ